MDQLSSGQIWGVALVAVGLIALIWIMATVNRFVKLRNHIKESWSDVDVALQRRHDLIPNLVATVKAYASHEQTLFEQIARERDQAILSSGNVSDRARDEAALGQSVGTLMARAEAYPQLKASQNYLDLQRELANTEDRIAAARRFYNANVRDYDTMLDSLPSSMIGRFMNYEAAPYFEVTEAAARDIPFAGS